MFDAQVEERKSLIHLFSTRDALNSLFDGRRVARSSNNPPNPFQSLTALDRLVHETRFTLCVSGAGESAVNDEIFE